MPGHIREFKRLKQHSSHDLVFKIWWNNNTEATLRVFLSLIVNYVGISLHRRGRRGCERLTIFMQSRAPLGPGKFHVVVLVSPNV